MVKIRNNIIFFIMLIIPAWVTLAANITATVDRNPVQMGESFKLVLQGDSNPGGNPDLTPLEKDFDLIGRNQNSSIQVINGKMTKSLQWIVVLMPKREGKITIPAIHFGNDKSNSIRLTVTKTMASGPGKPNDTIFLEVTVAPKETWVQAQIIYTVRLYHSVNLSNASLTEPKLNDADAVIEKLGKDSEFNTRVDGKQYRIIERRYAIFPQRSGNLTIEPVVFNGQFLQNSTRFMRDPFAVNVRNKRVTSDAVNIKINAAPGTQKANTWLPAKNIKLSEEWQDGSPEFRVGESVTRTLTLVADGLTAAQLPELATVAPKGFKQYPDQPLLEDKKISTGITGSRQQKVALIPIKPGRYTLPEINLKWWNTKTKREETAHLPSRNIQVLAALDSTLPEANLPQGMVGQDTESPENISNEITDATNPDNNIVAQAGYWPWVSLVLIIGWLSTLFMLWPSRKHNTQDTKIEENNIMQSRKDAERKLKQACAENDAHAAKEALLLWGKSIFPDNPPSSLTALGKDISGNIANQLIVLNKALYSQLGNEWTSKNLWEDIKRYKHEPKKNVSHSKKTLAPMYPG